MNRWFLRTLFASAMMLAGCEGEDSADEVEEPEAEEPEEAAADSAEVEALRAQVSELQAQIAQQEEVAPPPTEGATPVVPEPVGEPETAPTPATTPATRSNNSGRAAEERPERMLGRLIREGQRQVGNRGDRNNDDGDPQYEEEEEEGPRQLPIPLLQQ